MAMQAVVKIDLIKSLCAHISKIDQTLEFQMSQKLALITGASAGIGKEFARYHAGLGGDVIIVARREEALHKLAAELVSKHGVKAHVFAADLGTVEGTTALYNAVKAKGHDIDILINNAGFGFHGLFQEADLSRNLAMVDLNIKSLVTLTHLVLQDMVAKRSGKILHVGSTAGMIPGPFQATYHATKAFVNSFSLALSEELRDKGITSTVLTPGPVATEFFDVADMKDAKGVQGKMPSAASVAKIGYDGMMAGKLVVFNDPKLRFLLEWVVPFLPRKMVLKIGRDFGEKV